MDIKQDFEKASKEARKLPDQSNEILLKLYALYKQATEGDVSGKRPGFLDLKGRAKFDAWTGVKSTSKDQAMTLYIAQVEALKKDA